MARKKHTTSFTTTTYVASARWIFPSHAAEQPPIRMQIQAQSSICVTFNPQDPGSSVILDWHRSNRSNQCDAVIIMRIRIRVTRKVRRYREEEMLWQGARQGALRRPAAEKSIQITPNQSQQKGA